MKLSKILPVITLSLASIFSSPASAQVSVEELCFRYAEVNVRMKELINLSPEGMSQSLSVVNKTSTNKEQHRKGKERVYFVYNRKNLSDEDMRSVSLVQCFIEYN